MQRHFEDKVTLEWSHKGKFSATITNGIVTALQFCEPGTGPSDQDSCGRCLTSTDLKFLQDVHQSLGELFKEIEAANQRLGYSFALPATNTDDTELQTTNADDTELQTA